MRLQLVHHSAQSRATMEALAQGISACGDLPELIGDSLPDSKADAVVSWGTRLRFDVGIPHLYLEAGYINGTGDDYVKNRLRFVSAEWNGVGDYGDPIGSVPGDRWDRLGIETKPWREPGDKLLVLEQHPSDGAANPRALDAALDRVQGFSVRRRPHPLVESTVALWADLSWADCAITFGSTAAVEAVIEGVPTVTLSERCVARAVTVRTLEEARAGLCSSIDRRYWCHQLAYRQWTHKELATGEAWSFLRDRAR